MASVRELTNKHMARRSRMSPRNAEIDRFASSRKLVGYLGLDPIVSQSGASEASHGRISKQGSASGRYALVKACWSVVKAPGPLRAFYERTRARRGAQVAIVATAPKLACLFWCLPQTIISSPVQTAVWE